MSFSQNDMPKVHVKKHTVEKPFRWNFCYRALLLLNDGYCFEAIQCNYCENEFILFIYSQHHLNVKFYKRDSPFPTNNLVCACSNTSRRNTIQMWLLWRSILYKKWLKSPSHPCILEKDHQSVVIVAKIFYKRPLKTQ